MVIIHDRDPESVAKMIQVDRASVDGEPEDPNGNFSFHRWRGGVAAFRGRPPWEFHGRGEELLLILAGNSELTVHHEGGRSTQDISRGQRAIVPRGHWHANHAHAAVTMPWITPGGGNEHSWDELHV
jgi:mannose-6-phosphate isomerase-like protein (cupin superfamily)